MGRGRGGGTFHVVGRDVAGDDALEEAGPGKGLAQRRGVWGERGGGRVTGWSARSATGAGVRRRRAPGRSLAGEGIVAGSIADERHSIGDDVSRRPVEGTGGVELNPWSCGAGLVEARRAGKAFERLPEEVDFPRASRAQRAWSTTSVTLQRTPSLPCRSVRRRRTRRRQVHLADRADPATPSIRAERRVCRPRLATGRRAAGDDGSGTSAPTTSRARISPPATNTIPHPHHPPVRLPRVGDLERCEEVAPASTAAWRIAWSRSRRSTARAVIAPVLVTRTPPRTRTRSARRRATTRACVRHARPPRVRRAGRGASASAQASPHTVRGQPPVEEDDPVPRRRQVPGRRRPARPRANHDDVRICGNVHGRSGVYGNARFPAAWGVRSSCRPLKTVLPVPGHQDKPKNRMPVGPCIWEIRFVG